MSRIEFGYLPYKKACYVRGLMQKAEKVLIGVEGGEYDANVKYYMRKVRTNRDLTIENWCGKLEISIIILKDYKKYKK